MKWKTDIYGEPFNYQSKETRIRILDNNLINRPFQIALIYEGETEDYVIHEIFKVLNIDEDLDGVFLWKAKGQGNIETNMYGLAELARAIEMRIFLILDRDTNWNKIIDEFKRRRYINDNSYCVWNKDFESDNFTLD